jgi:hypothetical protein
MREDMASRWEKRTLEDKERIFKEQNVLPKQQTAEKLQKMIWTEDIHGVTNEKQELKVAYGKLRKIDGNLIIFDGAEGEIIVNCKNLVVIK